MSIRLIKTTLLVSAIIPVSGIIALGQDAAKTVPDQAAASVPATESKPLVVKGKDILTVDFPDEEIRVILRNVADMFDLNLVIPETLQGKSSIKLRDVTWRQIYQVVLQPVGYTFIEDGNIIKVVTQESLNLEPLTTEVFILNYAKAAEIKPSLDAQVDAKVGGKIVVDARSNALVVTERGSVMQKLKPIILNLDRPNEQVMIESKFIEVTNADSKNLGVNWASLSGYSTSVTPGVKFDQTSGRSRSNSTTLTDLNPAVWSTGRANLSQIEPGAGLIPSRTITTTQVASNYPGAVATPGATIYDPSTGITTTQPTTYSVTTTKYDTLGVGSTDENKFTNDISRVTTAVFSADSFKVVLSALQSLSKTKLVSNPTVVTLNNSEASINVGDEIPIPNFAYNQQTGSFEISGFTYKAVGVNLKVVPQVNNAGFVKLTVEPEVSQTNDVKSAQYGTFKGSVIPVITTRKTKTQVTMKDGYTLGIGGMIQKVDSKTQTKVPILGDIPFLGRLFRSDTTSGDATNLVIFLTAKTIKPDGGDVSEVFDPRLTRQMEIQKTDLPGYRDGSQPFYTPPPPEPKKKGWFSK